MSTVFYINNNYYLPKIYFSHACPSFMHNIKHTLKVIAHYRSISPTYFHISDGQSPKLSHAYKLSVGRNYDMEAIFTVQHLNYLCYWAWVNNRLWKNAQELCSSFAIIVQFSRCLNLSILFVSYLNCEENRL